MTFIEARLRHQSIPTAWEVVVNDPGTDQSFEIGALGTLTAAGQFLEATSPDPTVVTHVSQTPFGVPVADFTVPYPRTFVQRTFPPGKAIVTDAVGKEFRAEFVGSLPVATGGYYGCIKGADGKWRVDFTDIAGDQIIHYLRPITPQAAGIGGFTVREVIVEIVQPAVNVP